MEAEEIIKQREIVKHLEEHKATAQWMKSNKEGYTMDIPMMVVSAMMDFESLSKPLHANSVANRVDSIGRKLPKALTPKEISQKYANGHLSCTREIIRLVKSQLPTEGEGWISVEDRLPEDVKVVLFYSEFYNKVFMGYTEYRIRATSIVYFVDVNSKEVGDNKLEETTHWQPLPHPPVKEEKEEK